MSTSSTKREVRDERRAARIANEQRAAASAARRKRFQLLGGVVGVGVLAVLVAVLVSNSGAPKHTAGASGAAAKAAVAQVAGIPEHGGVLGNPNAKLTVTEFIDLQCPICKMAASQTLPTLLDKYVRTGKVKLQARPLQFIGPQSVTAARVAAGAEQQGKLWPFIEAFYASQGEENSGYVTTAFLRSVCQAAGVDADKALAYAKTDASQAPLEQANSQAQTLGVNATPTFAYSLGGGTAILADGSHDPNALSAAIDKELNA